MADPHSVLGVPKTATQDEVKAAWRRLVLEHHPDRNPGRTTAESFKKVQAAYRMLVQEPVHADGGMPRSWPEGAAQGRFHRPPGVSRTLQLCAMGLITGCGIFYGAVLMHTQFDMYGSKKAAEPPKMALQHEFLKEAVEQERARGKMIASGGKSL